VPIISAWSTSNATRIDSFCIARVEDPKPMPKLSNLTLRPAITVASDVGFYAQAAADVLLCFAALAVLFFAGTVITCRTCRKANQGSGA